MIRKRHLLAVGLAFAVIAGGTAATRADPTTIRYALSDVGENAGDTDRWLFEWTVRNNTLPQPLEDFVIYFDFGPGPDPYIKSLDVEADVLDWTEFTVEPSSPPPTDGYFEAWANVVGLSAGESQSGFACSFDWLGQGPPPGVQAYEIYDASMHVIDSGRTVLIPAPGSVVLGLIGLTCARLVGRRARGAQAVNA